VIVDVATFTAFTAYRTMDKVQKGSKKSFTCEAAKLTWIKNLHNEHNITITFRKHMQNITITKTTQ
jgi:hypothetical protein